jgi:type VI protein secretion system component VasK
MSLRWRDRRKELFSGAAAREAGSVEMRRDWSARRQRPRRRIAWAPIFAVGVVSLLALAALRVSILRTRYALAATLQRETELRGRERSAAVAARQQRDPHKLRELATQLGFARPERVIDLEGPAERP